MKNSGTTTKIKYTEGMKCNIMDYLQTGQISSSVTTTYPYCGYTLIENTNISDNAVPNPTITQLLTENPYSFTPQPNMTYVVLQQLMNQSNLLVIYYKSNYYSSSGILTNYRLHFFVPNNVNNAGMIINGVDYNAMSDDESKKVHVANTWTIGSTVVKRNNSYVIWLEIIDLLKQGSDLEVIPYMITADGVRVESYFNKKVAIKEGSNLESLLYTDISLGNVVNPNYPNFITPPSEGNAED